MTTGIMLTIETVVFISCKPPVDPVELVVKYVNDVQNTGVTRTRSELLYWVLGEVLIRLDQTCPSPRPCFRKLRGEHP